MTWDQLMDRERRPTIGDAMLWAIVLAVVCLGMCTGCASTDHCAGCPPRLETQIIKQSVPCVIPIDSLDPMVLPGWPVFPGHDATDAEVDTWLADLKATKEKREALLTARVTAQAAQIDTHNSLEPRCSEIE